MGAKSLDLIHKYTNSKLIFDFCSSGFKNTNPLSKRFVVQNHQFIINKHKFEHNCYHSKKSLKISKHLYTNIFYHVSQRYIDINWTRDGFQFSVNNPYLVLSTVADIDTLSIENCQVKIRTGNVCISISYLYISEFRSRPEYALNICHGNVKLPNINQSINIG